MVQTIRGIKSSATLNSHEPIARSGRVLRQGLHQPPVAGEVSSGALRATRKWAAPAVVAGFLTTLYSASAAETISALGVPWKIGAPIVTYWCGPALTDAVAKQMAEGGWNVVWCNEPSLDIAQRPGSAWSG